jgi:hypothetical protein
LFVILLSRIFQIISLLRSKVVQHRSQQPWVNNNSEDHNNILSEPPPAADDLLVRFAAAAARPPAASSPSQIPDNTEALSANEAPAQTASLPAPVWDLNRPRICGNHPEYPDRPGRYFCPSCQSWHCEDCVNLYQLVAVCPTTDTLCLTWEKYQQVYQEQMKLTHTFDDDLRQALTFPVRHWSLTLLIVIVGWLLAGSIEILTDLIHPPSLGTIFFGAQSVGALSLVNTYIVLAGWAINYLLRRADGREEAQLSPAFEFTDLARPFLLWQTAALVSFSPLLVYLFYDDVQILTLMVMTGNDFSEYLQDKPSVANLIAGLLCLLWALLIYPAALITAGSTRSPWQAFHPYSYYEIWVNRHGVVKKAIGAFWLISSLGILISYFCWVLPGSLLITSTIATVVTLASFVTLGAALDRKLWEDAQHLNRRPTAVGIGTS